MKSKREEEKIEDEYEAKRQKLLHPSTASSPPQPAFNNPLFPLSNYKDDDDEEEDEQAYLDNLIENPVQNEENGLEHQEGEENGIEHQEGMEEEGEDDEIGVAQGQRNRMIELRRDCLYLDTVNRQVVLSIISSSHHYSPDSSDTILTPSPHISPSSDSISPQIVIDIPSSPADHALHLHFSDDISLSSDDVLSAHNESVSPTPPSMHIIVISDGVSPTPSSSAAVVDDSSTSALGPPQPFNYGKMIVCCTYLLMVLSSGLTTLSMRFPHESAAQTYSRATTLIVISVALLTATIIKIFLEHKQDKAGLFYYHSRRGSEKIFYRKVVEQVIGLLVITCNFVVVAANYLITKYNEGLETAYYLTVFSIATSLLYNACQTLLKPKKITLMERTTNGVVFRRLRVCRDIPPEGNSELYEVDPEYEPEDIY